MENYRQELSHAGTKGMKWGVRNQDTLRKYGLLKTAAGNKGEAATSSQGSAGMGGGSSSEDDEMIEILDPITGEKKKVPKRMVTIDDSLDGKKYLIDKKTGKPIEISKMEYEAFKPLIDKGRYYVSDSDNPDDVGAYRRKKQAIKQQSYKEMVDGYDKAVEEYNHPINAAKRFLNGLFKR